MGLERDDIARAQRHAAAGRSPVGVSGTTFGSAAFDPDATLAAFLRSEANGERWDLATTSAFTASGLIAQDDLSVMALGGFLGSDPATSISKVAEQVRSGQIRFFLTGGALGTRFGAAVGGAGGFGARPPSNAPRRGALRSRHVPSPSRRRSSSRRG